MKLAEAIRYGKALEAYRDLDHFLSRMGLKDVPVESRACSGDEEPNLQKVARGPNGLSLSWSMQYRDPHEPRDPFTSVDFRVTSGDGREYAIRIEHHLTNDTWVAELIDPDTDPGRAASHPAVLMRLLSVSSIRFGNRGRLGVEYASATQTIVRMVDTFLTAR